jgi:nucleoside-diphosphate-sugar epimerase
MTTAQRVLVVGGTGFLGGHVVQALAAAGHQVTAMSRGQRPDPPGAEPLRADRRDPASLARALEGRRFDFTVDFAAYDAADIERLLLIPYAALGRYVMISTGQACLVTTAPHLPYREEDGEAPLKPEPPPGMPDHREWSYGAGKRRAEGVLLSLKATHGVRAVILRLPVMVGEGDSSLRTWAYLERMLDGGPILLPGGGADRVRFLYAGDLGRVVCRLVEMPPPRSTIYHLAQPDVVTLREVLERLAGLAGVSPRFVDVAPEDLEAAGLDRSCSPYSGPWVSLLDPARAAGEWAFLGLRLDEYLPAVTRWHMEHRPPVSHAGYARRECELALAARLTAGAR